MFFPGCIASILVLLAASPASTPTQSELVAQVRAAEREFAGTMAHRDHDAFTTYISEEALFFGGQTVLRGKNAVADGWKKYFEGSEAPFSWEPEQVEVLDSGTLALSSGPVRDPKGKQIGTFNSIWRHEDGGWRVIFDKGCPACRCP